MDSSHLIEYVAVVSYDPTILAAKNPAELAALPPFLHEDTYIKPKLMGRFPEADYAQSERPGFPSGLELYVFPSGARLSETRARTSCHSFVITNENGGSLYAFCWIHPVLLNTDALSIVRIQLGVQIDQNEDVTEKPLPTQIWGLSAVVLVSSQPLHTSLHGYLTAFAREQANQRLGMGPECCAGIYEQLSMWHRERRKKPDCSVSFSLGAQPPVIFPALRPSRESEEALEPPPLDIDYRVLFALLHPRAVAWVLEALLAESSVLLVAKELGLLTECMEIFLSLLRPLEWPFARISILPLVLSGYLEVPQPYFMGSLPQLAELAPDGTVVVDLERGKLLIYP
jgi:hypothetical protein